MCFHSPLGVRLSVPASTHCFGGEGTAFRSQFVRPWKRGYLLSLFAIIHQERLLLFGQRLAPSPWGKPLRTSAQVISAWACALAKRESLLDQDRDWLLQRGRVALRPRDGAHGSSKPVRR